MYRFNPTKNYFGRQTWHTFVALNCFFLIYIG